LKELGKLKKKRNLDTAVKNSRDIFARLKRSRNLPTLPQVLLKLMNACNDENCTPQRLSEIIFADPSLSAKVLQLVNSAYVGLREKVGSLDKAVVYLGTDTVKNIAISASVLQVFSKTQGNGVFNLPQFWWHSLMCASLARALAKETRYPAPEEAFLSGLLHDIGKLLLWANFRKEYAQIIREAESDPARLLAGETSVGALHCEVGAWLITRWKLNSFMADAIYYHHRPAEEVAEALPLVKIVYAANLLSRGEEVLPERVAATAGAMVDLPAETLSALSEKTRGKIDEVARSFGIPVVAPGVPPATEDTPEELGAAETLKSEVKAISLLHGTLNGLLRANERSDILQVAARGLAILFDVHSPLFFLYDGKQNTLVGQGVPGNTKSQAIDRVRIPLKAGKNILALTLQGRIPPEAVHPDTQWPLSIGEKQLLKLLGTACMKCLMLQADGKALGVMVVGLHPEQTAGFLAHRKLLDLFLGHISLCLHADRMKRMQAQIVQEERLNASMLLSRRVVHEVNNPLGIIKNYLKILSLKLPEKHPAQTELGIIGEEIDRIGQIILQLKDFSSTSQDNTPEQIDVNLLLSDLLRLLEDPLFKPAKVKVQFTPDAKAPLIMSEKNRLKQVFLNLMKNAVEALTDGGHLTIATQYDPPAEGESADAETAPPGELTITFMDDGPGIPEGIRRRLFEPFVSSKKQGRGLGLSIVHGIIRELDGTITCESKNGVGTTFIITLPTSDPGGETSGGTHGSRR
jgi:HD-like signal output (HDOD) protein/signal transduction histidine kinase